MQTLQNRIQSLPTNIQMRIATFAHPTLFKPLREDIHDTKLDNCEDCEFGERVIGLPDDGYWLRPCSCPSRNKLFRSISKEDELYDRHCEQAQQEERCRLHTRKFELFLQLLADPHQRKRFDDNVMETIHAEVTADIHADNAQMMAFCASVYQRKMNTLLNSDKFEWYAEMDRFHFATTLDVRECL